MIGLLLSLALNQAVAGAVAIVWIAATALVLAAFSLWDDRAPLSPGTRFGLHAAAAGVVVWGAALTVNAATIPILGSLPLKWAAIPFTLLFLMWMTNLYNFMDGMDGFAGGMSVIGFAFLGGIAWIGGQHLMAVLSILIAGSAGGFLLHNKPPAQIFMGDVGSVPLGFLAGALAVLGVHSGLFDLWVPLLIFSPFIIDATVTLLRRLLRGEKVWQAHREHYYQRLVLAGWGHKKTVLAEYGLMLISGVGALIYMWAGETLRLVVLLLWVALYVSLSVAVKLVEQGSAELKHKNR